MGVVVDSSVIIALERRGVVFDEYALGIQSEPAAIAAISVSELLMGVHRADTEQRRQERQHYLERIFSAVEVLPFDLQVARLHSRIWFQLASEGALIGDRDLLIAATAAAHGYALLTENVREFDRVPQLRVLKANW